VASITIYLVVIKKQGALGLIYGTYFSNLIMTIVYYFTVRQDLNWSFSIKMLKKILSFSSPLMLQGIFFWVLGMSDRAILGVYANLSEVGVYTLAYQLALVLQMINAAVSGSWRAFLFRTVDNPAEGALISELAIFMWRGWHFWDGVLLFLEWNL
jgi:O-antigen/teichoic acid export membrane protein